MADHNGNMFLMERPQMTWDAFMDPNIPPLDLEGDAVHGSTSDANGHASGPAAVEDWLQGSSANHGHSDQVNRHERALSTSAIPPEINIDFAPPSRTYEFDHNNASTNDVSSNWNQSPSLLPLDLRQRTRSPSPARSVGSGRIRSSSTGSIRRDHVLDLADPQRVPTPQQTARVQKQPMTFQCTLCPKRFTRAYNLRSHLRTHADERPFVCTVCGKAFARQHDRKRHEGLHSGEKKFVCRGTLADGSQWGCGRRFACADPLYRHFQSEVGQACIQPLVDEENKQRYAAWLKERPGPRVGGYLVSDDGVWHAPPCLPSNTLPEALLTQYPALYLLDMNDFPYSQPCDDSLDPSSAFASPPSRSSSFGASSYGSTGFGGGFGYNLGRSVSDKLSDTSLHSTYSATSFSSQRGTRVAGGYECGQCGVSFDIPSELRHHERNHMPKEQRPHACHQCGERFLYPKDVQRHINRKHASAPVSPLLSANNYGEGLGLEQFSLSANEAQLDPGAKDNGPRPVWQSNTLSEFHSFDFNWTNFPEPSLLRTDMQREPPATDTATKGRSNSHQDAGGGGPNSQKPSNYATEGTIPRSKSAEILDLKTALETAKKDARLWREERNFYAELLQHQMAPDNLNLPLKYVDRDEVMSPPKRAQGWLKGIRALFRIREKKTGNCGEQDRAIVTLATGLEQMELGGEDGGGGGDGKTRSRRSSRSSSLVRGKWKEFEGWMSGTG